LRLSACITRRCLEPCRRFRAGRCGFRSQEAGNASRKAPRQRAARVREARLHLARAPFDVGLHAHTVQRDAEAMMQISVLLLEHLQFVEHLRTKIAVLAMGVQSVRGENLVDSC
jgi:hypothetical protein